MQVLWTTDRTTADPITLYQPFPTMTKTASSPSSTFKVQVTQVQPHEAEEAALVMAKAFARCQSPVYEYILEGIEDPIPALTFMFLVNNHILLDKLPESLLCVRSCSSFSNGGGDDDDDDDNGVNGNGNSNNNNGSKIVAAFSLGKQTTLDLWTILIHGGWQLPFRLPFRNIQRLFQVMDDFERAEQDFYNVNDKSVMLERMTVLPEYQGRAIGSTALKQVLPKDTVVHLSTQEERNVTFYKKLGFEIVGERDFGDPGSKFHSWFMLRKVQDC